MEISIGTIFHFHFSCKNDALNTLGVKLMGFSDNFKALLVGRVFRFALLNLTHTGITSITLISKTGGTPYGIHHPI